MEADLLTSQVCLVKFRSDCKTFMAVNKAYLSNSFLNSQRARYSSFYNLNDQQLDLIISKLATRLSSSVKINVAAKRGKETGILAA